MKRAGPRLLRFTLGLGSTLVLCSGQTCDDDAFPQDFTGKQFGGLTSFDGAKDTASCRQACCDQGPQCEMYEFSLHRPDTPSCRLGKIGTVVGTGNYTSRGRTPPPNTTLRVSSVYGDSMVMQRAPSRSFLWGHSKPANTVTVRVLTSTAAVAASASSSCDTDGVWSVSLPPVQPSSPYAVFSIELTSVTSSGAEYPANEPLNDTLVLSDILFGDVWLCTGQSNMAFSMGMAAAGRGPLREQALAEIANSAALNGSIRVFNTGFATPAAPQRELPAAGPRLPWSRPSPAALAGASVMGDGGFTAVGWYFARHLQASLGVPVGIVMSTYGGTALESWMSRELLYGNGTSSDPVHGVCPADPSDPATAIPANSFTPPSSNFNGQIVPLTAMVIKGVLW
jgi:sialate O-acetylesterase